MDTIVIEISTIVVLAAVLAWLASVARQPVILAYLLCGVVAGPWGLGLVKEVGLVNGLSKFGITLLLFLAGVVLHPERLLQLFRKASVVVVGGCLVSAAMTTGVLKLCGLTFTDSVFAGMALMFSSTILVVKLLPTTTLHQRHMGALCIAVLVAQDLVAVALLLVIRSGGGELLTWGLLLPLKGLLFVVGALAVEQFVLRPMMRQSDQYHEVLYMLSLGWCLGLAVLAQWLGLSYEVGAFIAGVALARSPVSLFLSEQLKPVRDFFLMFFFFVLGARLDLLIVKAVWLPAVLTAAVVLLTRPLILRLFLRAVGEAKPLSRETGVRLGQASEFGMIMAVAAHEVGRVSLDVSQLVQLAVILTMVVSSYFVVFRYPSPLGTSAALKQD